jgi:hypothetical protein
MPERENYSGTFGSRTKRDDDAVIRLLTLIQTLQRNAIDGLLSELVAEVWVG